jgi:transcription elongation factor GreA
MTFFRLFPDNWPEGRAQAGEGFDELCNTGKEWCAAMANPVKLTPARLKELQDELAWMKSVREKEVAELIKEARSFGDLSENSEYDEAKEQQGKLYSREAEVEAILENYELIDEGAGFDGTANIGTTVKVLDPELDMEQELRIVGSQEADPMEGRISDESPLGKALMGKSVGDVVEVEAPAGVVEYRILDIYMS